MSTAKIYLEGPKDSIAPSSTVSLNLYLNTDTPVNAFDILISYPKEKATFLGLDNEDSIVDIWQKKGDSAQGKIDLSGGILQSYSGNRGLVGKISFKVSQNVRENVRPEDIKIAFEKSEVYLADGAGTRVIATSPTFNLKVESGAQILSTPPPTFEPTPSDLAIAEGVQDYKSDIRTEQLVLPALGLLVLLILVFYLIKRYNK